MVIALTSDMYKELMRTDDGRSRGAAHDCQGLRLFVERATVGHGSSLRFVKIDLHYHENKIA